MITGVMLDMGTPAIELKVRGSREEVTIEGILDTGNVSIPRLLTPRGRKQRMTQDEIQQEIEALTAQIRILSYSSGKEAQQKIATLQQQRRDLRAQLAEEK
jgi:hypothetical protein